MKNLRKIAAFTLTEMLIVLAITTVVAGLAFSIISLFGRNINLIQNNYEYSTKIDLFEQQLMVDFNQYHNIKYTSTSETMLLKTPIDSINYRFSSEYILRNSDTLFDLPYSNLLFFQGNQTEQGQIDGLKIEIKNGKRNTFLFFNTQNDATDYMIKNGD